MRCPYATGKRVLGVGFEPTRLAAVVFLRTLLYHFATRADWSRLRDSNARPQTYQVCALTC
jgi:hypothetical protein